MASDNPLFSAVQALEWYHTIDLGNGVITPGHYDHRPYLEYYRLPDDLQGRTVIDVGAASGFFAFEFERRGASVVATDLPEWFDHDFGPNYQADKTRETGSEYLHQPFEVARQALGSKVGRKLINIYDLSPQTVGTFDLAFCGSVLLHLTDPLKALWSIASVTRDLAIIATVIERQEPERPVATCAGYQRGDVWWIPTRACLELMMVAAGFEGLCWVSEFQLDYAEGTAGTYHGVVHGFKTMDNRPPGTRHRDEIISQYRDPSRSVETQLRRELQDLRMLVDRYERSRILRAARRFEAVLARTGLGSGWL